VRVLKYNSPHSQDDHNVTPVLIVECRIASLTKNKITTFV